MKNIQTNDIQYGITLEESASDLTQGVSGPELEAGMHRFKDVN